MGIVSLYNIAMNRSRGVGQFWSDWFNPEARLSWTLSCSVMTKDDWPREKKWKHVYIWSNKLHRAKQLGFEYPRVSESEMLDQESVKVLFVCSMNQWRSPTGEKIYSDKALVNARSCGTNKSARKKVSADDLKWTDIVFVMEEKHKQRLVADFPGEMRFKELHVLDIPDNYRFMDPELIDEIVAAVDPILARHVG